MEAFVGSNSVEAACAAVARFVRDRLAEDAVAAEALPGPHDCLGWKELDAVFSAHPPEQRRLYRTVGRADVATALLEVLAAQTVLSQALLLEPEPAQEVLALMASRWRHHPDYQSSWRVRTSPEPLDDNPMASDQGELATLEDSTGWVRRRKDASSEATKAIHVRIAPSTFRKIARIERRLGLSRGLTLDAILASIDEEKFVDGWGRVTDSG